MNREGRSFAVVENERFMTGTSIRECGSRVLRGRKRGIKLSFVLSVNALFSPEESIMHDLDLTEAPLTPCTHFTLLSLLGSTERSWLAAASRVLLA